ncbi:MAG: SRPBCC family protein [Candidatus Binatia bacterium]
MSLDAAQEVSLRIEAPQSACFAAILEFEHYPDWFSAIESAKILERDKAGVGRIVEFHIDMRIRRIRYVLEYAYKKPGELSWRSIDGDVESIEGRYSFKKVSPTITEAACRQEIRLGFWFPGPLRKIAERSALNQSVSEFKTAVEQRLATAKRPPTGKKRSPAA